MIEIVPLTGIGEIAPGADLARILAQALPEDIGEGAVLVVTQKIVSKAEGRFVALEDVVPSGNALRFSKIVHKDPRFIECVLRESSDVVRMAPNILITRHRLGFVMANAGIDRSNIGGGPADRVLLLPEDPDASARILSAALGMPVVISDSFGRPWREGVVGVAIGAAGLPALIDRRGQTDRDGRELEVTQVAVADMIASAAGLVTGEGDEGIPAVLVRGLGLDDRDIGASALVRPVEADLFR